MVTLSKIETRTTTTAYFEFFGKSTDAKPTTWAGYNVGNGSVYTCTDEGHAGEISLFDETAHQWNGVE